MSITLRFVVKTTRQRVSIPVTSKSNAQAIVNVLDMKHVSDVHVGIDHTRIYVPHPETNQLVSV